METEFFPSFTLSEFLDYFAQFDQTIDPENLRYLGRALTILISMRELNEGMDDEERLALFRKYEGRFSDHRGMLFDPEGYDGLCSERIPLLLKMVGSMDQCLDLIKSNPDSRQIRAWTKHARNSKWSYEEYFRVFGDEMPNQVKMSSHFANAIWGVFDKHSEQAMKGNRAFRGESELTGEFEFKDLQRLIPDFSGCEDAKEAEYRYWDQTGEYPGLLCALSMPAWVLEEFIIHATVLDDFSWYFTCCEIHWTDVYECFNRVSDEMKLKMAESPFERNVLIQVIDVNLRDHYEESEKKKAPESFSDQMNNEELSRLISGFIVSDKREECIAGYIEVMKEGEFEQELMDKVVRLMKECVCE